MPLGPVVRDGVREDRAGAVERGAGHRTGGGLEGWRYNESEQEGETGHNTMTHT